MTRPTPTQGAQSEAARVPRVSDARVDGIANRVGRIVGHPGVLDRLIVDLTLDLRDVRQASRDKDATIADLEQERDCLVEQVALLQEGALRQELQSVMARHNDVVADLERRLAEARDDLMRSEQERSGWMRRATCAMQAKNDERVRADALQARLTEAEQRAATAERRGLERALGVAETLTDAWHRDATETVDLTHRRETMADAGRRIISAIRALAPAVPQEGETMS